MKSRSDFDQHDNVNHPSHYIGEGLESIDVIEGWNLGFHLGNAMKYVLRAGRKYDKLEDLKKARWYLRRVEDECVVVSTGEYLGPTIPSIVYAFDLDKSAADIVSDIIVGTSNELGILRAIALLDNYIEEIEDQYKTNSSAAGKRA